MLVNLNRLNVANHVYTGASLHAARSGACGQGLYELLVRVNCDAWADRRTLAARRRTRGDGGGGIDAAAPAGFIDVRKASSLLLLKAVISACIDTLLYGGGMVSSSQVDAQRQ